MLTLRLSNRQRGFAFDRARVLKAWQMALPLCLAESGVGEKGLAELPEVSAYVLSDRRISKMHADFLNDPTPTDVITFNHGELFLGAETIVQHAQEQGQSADAELLLCLIHGLLHLNGYDDHDLRHRRKMHERQFEILEAVRGGLC